MAESFDKNFKGWVRWKVKSFEWVTTIVIITMFLAFITLFTAFAGMFVEAQRFKTNTYQDLVNKIDALGRPESSVVDCRPKESSDNLEPSDE